MAKLNFNISNFYVNILPLILFVYIIVIDSINGYMQEFLNIYTPVGLLTRGLILGLIFNVIFKKSHSNIVVLFKILTYVYLLAIPLWIVNDAQISLYEELNYFFKFVYFFVVLLYFYHYRNSFVFEKIIKYIVYSAFIIALLNIICFIFGTGIKSYGEDYGFGTKAFYVDGNSLGLYMVLSNCVSTWYAFYKKRKWMLAAIIITCGTMLIGSRTAIVGSIIVWVSMILYILLKSKDIIHMSILNRITVCLIMGGVILYGIYSMTRYISNFDTYTLAKFSVESAVSPRENLIKEGNKLISDFNILEPFIGKSRSGGINELGANFLSQGEKKSIEADFHDMILCFGWFFGGLMILVQILISVRIIKIFVKHPSSLTFSFCLFSILWIATSYMAGHGFNNTMLAPIIGAVYMLSIRICDNNYDRQINL